MSREPFRRLERRLSDLEDDDGDDGTLTVAFRDDRTGKLEDSDGNPVDPDDHDADQLVIITESLIMERGKAERENREILEPAGGEGVPEGRDLVRVADDGRPFQRRQP